MSIAHPTFWIHSQLWAAFKARCEREGVKPTVKVRELVTEWAIADDPDWTD